LLLEAVAVLRCHFPALELAILGAGPQETLLKTQSRALNLDGCVALAGNVEEPACWFPGADLFVLSSRQEGLPNSLLNAVAAGLPIVALPASGGVVDLLQGQQGCWLAPEVSAHALSASLLSALQTLRSRQRFQHTFIEAIKMDPAIAAYEQLIDATIQGGHR